MSLTSDPCEVKHLLTAHFRITPWLTALGYRNTFIMVAVIGFAWNASLFVMVRIGPKLRAASAERYWKDVAKARAKGLGH